VTVVIGMLSASNRVHATVLVYSYGMNVEASEAMTVGSGLTNVNTNASARANNCRARHELSRWYSKVHAISSELSPDPTNIYWI
jgi:hypothetical protein